MPGINLSRVAQVLLVILSLSVGGVCAPEEAHFRRLDIPATESRLSELARVREFRVSCDQARFSGQTLLIAELYRDGRRAKAFRLSRAVYDESLRKKTGTVSIGWQRDLHRLVCIHDNGDFYSPWTSCISLPEFVPLDALYFENSRPETRVPEGADARPFKLYPVLGLCGQRDLKLSYRGLEDGPSFLKACKKAGARDAVMVYLYHSDHGEEPPMAFEKEDSGKKDSK